MQFVVARWSLDPVSARFSALRFHGASGSRKSSTGRTLPRNTGNASDPRNVARASGDYEQRCAAFLSFRSNIWFMARIPCARLQTIQPDSGGPSWGKESIASNFRLRRATLCPRCTLEFLSTLSISYRKKRIRDTMILEIIHLTGHERNFIDSQTHAF